MKKPVVFSLVHEQSVFMTIIMSLLTFLSVLALGICLSIGTGVMRWNNQWELFATVQITNHDKQDTIKQILATHADKIDTVTEISDAQMNELMSPWISDGGVLQNYLPKMWELKFKNQSDMDTVGAEISKVAKFLTHATALKPSTDAGWYMIMMTALILNCAAVLLRQVDNAYDEKIEKLRNFRNLEIISVNFSAPFIFNLS